MFFFFFVYSYTTQGVKLTHRTTSRKYLSGKYLLDLVSWWCQIAVCIGLYNKNHHQYNEKQISVIVSQSGLYIVSIWNVICMRVHCRFCSNFSMYYYSVVSDGMWPHRSGQNWSSMACPLIWVTSWTRQQNVSHFVSVSIWLELKIELLHRFIVSQTSTKHTVIYIRHFSIYVSLPRFNWHFEAEIKWPKFSRRHFQMHFLEWKCMNFD